MILSRNSKLALAVPAAATERELFAAEELQKYLGKIFGFNAKIVKDTDAPPEETIIIGGPERNKLAEKYISEEAFKAELTGPEGIYIKDFGSAIIIAGSSWCPNECERGTIYATYEFFERFLSCSFAAYSDPAKDIGEIVPEADEVNLDGIYYCKPKADRPYRTAIVQFADAATSAHRVNNKINYPFLDWLAKNRYNRILTWTSIYDKFKETGFLEEVIRRGIRFTVGHHEASRLFMPPYGNAYFSERYYETHPEYMKLTEDGSRFNNINHWGQWVFCSRNENAIAEISKNVSLWIEQNPAVDIIAFWPNDGTAPQCLCPDCQKYTKTENYCYFVNEVAKRVKLKHPNIKFDMLIYTDLWECPEGLELDPSILIDESTWHATGLRSVGKPDGSCLIGTFYQENLKRWRKTGADVVYYDYYMGVYGCRQRVIPMADELQSLWKSFVAEDFAGSGTQIEPFNVWNNIFNFYCFARVGYDTSLSMDKCLASFKRLFGDGGDEIAAAITKLEAALDGQVNIQGCGHCLMENVNREELYSHYEHAFELAKTPRERNNVRLMRMAFRYTDIETAEKESHWREYHSIEEGYDDESGELGKMSEFDSFYANNPGLGIAFPLRSKNRGKYPSGDKWYEFE